MKFLQGLVGENLLYNLNIMSLIDDIYKIMEWKPDPLGEPRWNNISYKDDEDFGVIEFIVSSEHAREQQKRRSIGNFST